MFEKPCTRRQEILGFSQQVRSKDLCVSIPKIFLDALDETSKQDILQNK